MATVAWPAEGHRNQTSGKIGPDHAVRGYGRLRPKDRPECSAFKVPSGTQLSAPSTEIGGGLGWKLPPWVASVIMGPEQSRPAAPPEWP